MMKAQDTPMQVRHGHDGERVVLMFSRPTDNMAFREEQAQAFIRSIQQALEGLRAHKAGQVQQPAAPAPEAANG